MPFWWNRRQRWWRGRRRPYYKRRKYYKKRRRRPIYRRKYTRATRRRRKRRAKVRRKKKTINIKQWQPDTIRKCKIKGYTVHVLGGQGKQFACYTDVRFDWTPPTTPGGGGFGVEKYTLQYLFQEYQRGNNIWTSSNLYLDLCRYTGCKFIFYRHPNIDFIVHYSRMYPMELDKFTYANSHPFELLKSKHHVIIPSLKHKPYGKRTKTIKVKPPKQITTRWFFQETFSSAGLLKLTTAAADLSYSYLGCCDTNRLITFFALNLQFYENAGWGNATVTTTYGWYKPRHNIPDGTWSGTDINGKRLTAVISSNPYQQSISYEHGWFQPSLLQMVTNDHQEVNPTTAGRYNPTIDTGDGNQIWLVSVLNTKYDIPTTDPVLYIENLPMWQLMYGFTNYVIKMKKDSTFLQSYYLVIKSKFIEPHHGLNKYYVPIDQQFIKGKGPYGSYVTTTAKAKWYPTLNAQLETINLFVQCGPYIPKLDNQKISTWELKSKYIFYFKWGGAELPGQETADPSKQGTYEIPSKLQQAIQIIDPKFQKAKHAIHAWDLRRGLLTRKAAKRILQDTESSSSVQTDSEEEVPQKKQKIQGNSLQPQEEEETIQDCLLSLCEEPTYQEIQDPQNLQQLIYQQQQQQQQIKFNLLQLILNLKKKQQTLQLQTGLLN